LLKGELDERDMKVYYSVRLVGFSSSSMSSEGGLQLAVDFETNQRVGRWEANTSLMYGNLLCLSPGGRFNQVRDFQDPVSPFAVCFFSDTYSFSHSKGEGGKHLTPLPHGL
jgi:hypothetical protein